jgi:hypothetical protein
MKKLKSNIGKITKVNYVDQIINFYLRVFDLQTRKSFNCKTSLQQPVKQCQLISLGFVLWNTVKIIATDRVPRLSHT